MLVDISNFCCEKFEVSNPFTTQFNTLANAITIKKLKDAQRKMFGLLLAEKILFCSQFAQNKTNRIFSDMVLFSICV